MPAKKPVSIRVLSAVVIDGKVRKPGHEREVSDSLARNLFERDRAELATRAAADEAGEAGDGDAPEKAKAPTKTRGRAAKTSSA